MWLPPTKSTWVHANAGIRQIRRAALRESEMKISTIVLLLGVVLFVLPVPGTFIGGGLVLVVGALARWFGL
ncbi:hypothetical protein Harman_11470 [Haloarcula mannanilytica]|uniref:Uncharacterized protein n=1 Tax=Haloarcula mannanilytica TaxID=2509225 RepID=A0A4C2EFS5_9EURY|nr:hypothetical protein Harman_11470 [Haloarcula mannanilytica]